MSFIYRLILLAVVMLAAGNTFAQPYLPLTIGDTVKGPAWEMIRVKGKKLYILDFWSTFCTSCIKAFPKMEQLQQDFDKELQVWLVNSYETKPQIDHFIKSMNERFRKSGSALMQMPSLPRMDGDSVLKQLFPHVGVPHHVWLDGAGKVLAITSGTNASHTYIKTALEGKPLNLAYKRDLKAEGYDAWKVGLIQSGHPELKPAFYSGFILYTAGLGAGNAQSTDTAKGMFRRSWLNTNILDLYWSASSNMPIKTRFQLKLDNPGEFALPDSLPLQDSWRAEYIFSYEMVLPIEDKSQIGSILLADLNRFCRSRFGIEGVLEKHKRQAYVLVVRDPSKLKTAGGERKTDRSGKHLSWQNTPLPVIGTTLWAQLENMDQGILLVNEIDPDSKLRVDMKLTVDRQDMQGLKKQLQQYGLDLIQEERIIDILVVRKVQARL